MASAAWSSCRARTAALTGEACQRGLPSSALEMALMDRLFGDTLDVLTGSQATRAAVLSGLPGHAIAHFACHASADLASPSDSGLLVHDHQERALIVSQVIALDLP